MQVSLRTTPNHDEHRQHMTWARTSAGLLLLAVLGGCAASYLAGRITEANIAERISGAKTAADHEAISAYFRAEAERIASERTQHEQVIVNSYKEAAAGRHAGPAQARIRESMREHCRGLTRSYAHVQENYLRLAEDHARMARELIGRQ